jgi:hypothetical protein
LILEEIVDIERSFSYPFEDKEWAPKLGLGAVLGLIPILNFAVSGYMVGIIRNVMSNASEPLPTWNDLGKKFTDGLIIFAANFIYALPMLILLCLPLSMLAFSGILSGDNDMQDAARALAGIGSVLFFSLLCLFVIYGLFLSILHPAILVMFAREGTFASCFKLRQMFELISRNAGSFFTAWGISLLTSLGVGLAIGLVNGVISWIPCLGSIIALGVSMVAGMYIASVYSHLFGQFARETLGPNELMPVG